MGRAGEIPEGGCGGATIAAHTIAIVPLHTLSLPSSSPSLFPLPQGLPSRVEDLGQQVQSLTGRLAAAENEAARFRAEARTLEVSRV